MIRNKDIRRWHVFDLLASLRAATSFLSPLCPLVGLDHVGLLLVGTVLLLPGIALVAEFVHFAGADGSVLLATRKANHPQALEGERGDSLLEDARVLE